MPMEPDDDLDDLEQNSEPTSEQIRGDMRDRILNKLAKALDLAAERLQRLRA